MLTKKVFGHKEKCYGVVTVGERGQVVIPNELRKELKIKSGEKLLVLCRFGKIIAMIRSDEIEKMLSGMVKNLGLKLISNKSKK